MDSPWKVSVAEEADAEISELEPEFREAILAVVESFSEAPFPPDAIHLKGTNDLYRIRLDGYRIVYRVNRRRRTVRVERVRRRSVAYRGLEPKRK